MDEQRDPRDRLPPEIYDFAIRAGSDAGRSVASISLRQTGRMRHGEGRLDVRALGMISLVRSVGSPALTPRRTIGILCIAVGTGRHTPQAELRWRFHSRRWKGEVASQVSLTLDDQGQITETFAPDRPRVVKSGIIPTPWRGRFFD